MIIADCGCEFRNINQIKQNTEKKTKQIRDNTNQSVDNDCITKFISLYKPLIFPTV